MPLSHAQLLPTISESLVQTLGHTLWEGTLIAFVVWLALRMLPARRAESRYVISAAGLILVVCSAFATWSVLRSESVEPVRQQHQILQRDHSIPATIFTPTIVIPVSDASLSSKATTKKHLPPSTLDYQTMATWLSATWLCVATLLLLRGLFGVATVRSWVATPPVCQPAELAILEQITQELRRRLKLRRVIRLLVSDRISIPAVIGTLWPTILIPAAMMSGVSVEQWRIVIAHELAHVRRWDALVGIAQMVVESLLFFNPAVWWLSHQMRMEREDCCDATAARLCGHPFSVARSLVEVAAASLSRNTEIVPQSVSSGVMAFSAPTPERELTDRVHRLVEPNRAPHSRVSWVGLTLLFIMLAVLGACLKWGSDLAVQTAAKWMSPKERIDALVQLEAERNGKFVPEEDSDFIDMTSDTDDRDEVGAERIPVELIVRMDDGSPIDKELRIWVEERKLRHKSGGAIDGPRSAVREFRTLLYYPRCQFRVAAGCPGRADVVSPQIALLPSEEVKTVELVLSKGSTVTVLVQDESQRPVAHAWVRIRESVSQRIVAELESDDDGKLNIEHIGKANYTLEIIARGFQRIYNASLNGLDRTNKEPPVIRLKPAKISLVRVVDAESNQPVPFVRFRIWERFQSGSTNINSYEAITIPDRWDDFATSNESGIATFDQLEFDTEYICIGVAEGYADTIVEVKPGDAEKTVKLSKPLVLAGRFSGHLERLVRQERNGKTVYQLDKIVRLRRTRDHHKNPTSSGYENANFELDENGHFSITDLSPGEEVQLHFLGVQRDFVMNKSITDVEIEIPAETPKTWLVREVVIRLTGTDEGAPARGQLSVSWQKLGDQKAPGLELPLRANEVRFEAPIGATVGFNSRQLVGYLIDDRWDVQVVSGEGPQFVEVATTPTGAIQGTIFNHDGTPADQWHVSTFRVSRSQNGSNDWQIAYVSSRMEPPQSSQFLSTVPLGGVYRIFVSRQTDSSCVVALSEDITIDRANPIAHVDIKLPPGRDVPVRILDPDGRPVIGQRVELGIGLKKKTLNPHLMSAFHLLSITAETSADGFATFRGVSINQVSSPFHIGYLLSVAPEKHCGFHQEIDPQKPLDIHLKSGVSASGVVVDAASEKGVRGATVKIHSLADFSPLSYSLSMTTTTDQEGRFHFDGLEPIKYEGWVTDARPKGSVAEGLRLIGGSKSPVRWEVVISPDSPLIPTE